MPRRGFATASTVLLGALVLAALVGCTGSAPSTGGESASEGTTATAGSGATGAVLGQQIYLAGIGADGEQILVEGPKQSQGAMTMGGGGCAACHGMNGRGGTTRTAAGTEIKAPDITYQALVKAGFTDKTMQYAIQWCQDEEGQLLGPAMPCWQMTDEEAAATIAFIKTLK